MRKDSMERTESLSVHAEKGLKGGSFMERRLFVITGCFLFLISGYLLSQEPRPDRDRIRERIEMVRVWKMTEALDLSKEQADRLLVPLEAIEEKRRDLREENGRLMKNLRSAVAGENPDEGAVKDLLDQLERLEDRIRETDGEERTLVRSVLSPVQEGRYVVFKRNFERELRNIVRDVRQQPDRNRPNEPRPRGQRRPPGQF
jgi:Spy/CpxP family protein refolding chaperone